MLRRVAAALLCAAAPCGAKLQKVIALARHGNRAPNSQILYVCPNAMPLVRNFSQPVEALQKAALTRIGMAENWESGRFLRERYGIGPVGEGNTVIPQTWVDDGSTFFFSERMNRNVQSLEALLNGLYPLGTGKEGFQWERPNFVPFLTSQPFQDTLINLPRDGPCKKKYKSDLNAWSDAHQSRVIEENRKLLTQFGDACGYDFTKPTRKAPLSWALKAAADCFAMAANEGIDYTMNGHFDAQMLAEVRALAGSITNEQRFGKDYQNTYWIGRLIDDALLANMRVENYKKENLKVEGQKLADDPARPWKESPEEYFKQNKFLVFLNHREPFAALSNVWDIQQLTEKPLPSGSMLIWELHQDAGGEPYVRMFGWHPSQPSADAKLTRLRAHQPVADLYNTGHVRELQPGACGGKVCTLQGLEDSFRNWTARTGTWKEVCGLTRPGDMERAQDFGVVRDGDEDGAAGAALERRLFAPAAEPPAAPAPPVGVAVAAALLVGAVVGYAVARRGGGGAAPAAHAARYGAL